MTPSTCKRICCCVIGGGLLLVLLTSCQSEKLRQVDTVTTPLGTDADTVNPNAFWANVGMVFDPDSVRAGQRIGSLKVDRASVNLAYDSTRVGSVYFSGDIELAGRMMRHPDSDVDALCFEADSMSAARLPRWKGDARRPWFCFKGDDTAAKTLAADSSARVVLDRFVIHKGMSDEVNSARARRPVNP